MSSKHSRARDSLDLPGADNFQIIDGIGPGIERRLYSAGIQSYAQLAELSLDQLLPIVGTIAGMTPERIAKQDWIGQASRLAGEGKATPAQPDVVDQARAPAAAELVAPVYRNPYATFTVELLLDDDKRVRRTRATHVQGEREDSWAGWEPLRLLEFFVRQGELRILAKEAAKYAGITSTLAVDVDSPLLEAHNEPVEAVGLAASEPAQRAPMRLGGMVGLQELALSRPGESAARRILGADEPFSAELALDLTKVDLPANADLKYQATLLAKRIGDGMRLITGQAAGQMQVGNAANIRIAGNPLPRGIYRLEAAVLLSLPNDVEPGSSGLSALLEAGLLQVY